MATVKIHGKRVAPDLRVIGVAPDNDDVESLLLRLANANPSIGEFLLAEGKLRSDLGILINGRHCMFINGLSTKILAEDIIDILMPVIGG